MENSIILRTIKDVFEDKDGSKYWFNLSEYLSARGLLSNRELLVKIHLTTEKGRLSSDETLLKRISRANKYADGCKGGAVGIDTIKQLGLALKENERAFLTPITLQSYIDMGKCIIEKNKASGIEEIYDQLNKILYILEQSYHYNYIPNTGEDGESYFRKIIIDIRKNVDKLLWNNQNRRKSIYEIVDEVEFIINSCSMPGVPERWKNLNPKLLYYDCVYDIIKENYSLYESIKKRDQTENSNIRFSFYPSEQDVTARERYFQEKRNKYPNRSVDRLYQDELVETLNLRFNQCVKLS